MYNKGKGCTIPSDAQAREKLALYVYEYLLHVGAQKSAQTFLSEIRWEKNISLGEPPGFLHSWWCVFWDLYCAAPDRRETCEHSSEAKAFHDYSAAAAAAASPVLANLPPSEGTPGVPLPPGFFQGPPGSQPPAHTQPPPHNPSMGPHTQPFMSPRYPSGPRSALRMSAQPPAGVPGSQSLLPNTLETTRQQGPLGVAGPIQRMSAPRGLASLGPQSYGGTMLPPPNSLGGHGMLGMNMTPGGGRSWPNPTNTNSIPYSSSSPGSYVGAPGGGPPGTSIIPSPADSTNSSENMYTMIAPLGAGSSRSSFQMGPGAEGPLAGMAGMEPHHMNGTLGTADLDGLSKNSPNNMTGMSNPPGTPRDDGELTGNFLNPFQNESYSPSMTMSV
ncbi:single-stranded DNA-binding protein 3-like isoform X2 [Chiloscyllium plagiosum]|uniref:single-stranded DNA-binding protein 3-like isoform X2 n=1 Tax=Chiloscyllium plagiosum TaxID=36176 RepID=UPI001CB88320|nr:single-stranded DNA-binding protein 3-like isoform X2 [Chiloscyllium plagiosum]